MISPAVEDTLHTGYGEAVPSACEHPLYEVSGPVLDDTYVDLDSMHLHAASQSAFCVSCGREILVLLAPSAVESHAWVAYTNVHVSDLEHFYCERCELCGAVHITPGRATAITNNALSAGCPDRRPVLLSKK